MAEIASIPVAGPIPSLAPPRKPTAAVWLASIFIGILCLWGLPVGFILCWSGWKVEYGIIGQDGAQILEAVARNFGPHLLVPHLTNRILEGLLNIALSVVIGWCQFRAVYRRSRAWSFIVGVILLLSGLLGCAAHPFNLTWGIVDGAYLFSGIVMVRWGWRLRTPRPAGGMTRAGGMPDGRAPDEQRAVHT